MPILWEIIPTPNNFRGDLLLSRFPQVNGSLPCVVAVFKYLLINMHLEGCVPYLLVPCLCMKIVPTLLFSTAGRHPCGFRGNSAVATFTVFHFHKKLDKV